MIHKAWQRVIAARPRIRAGLVFLFGLLAGLAFAPTYLVPLWPLGFGVTLGLIYHAKTARMRLLISFLFSYGYMISSLYWIALAPTVSPQFYIAIPFALILLPALTAGFGTLALFIAGFWRRDPVSFAFLASALWLLMEWRRGIDFTGFAWNRAGMIWTADPATMQIASLGGVPLLTACSVLVGAGVFFFSVRHVRLGAALAIIMPVLMLGFGAVRLGLTPLDSQETIPNLNVRLVQANIPKNTWDGRFVFEEHIRLSTRRPLDGITHVIWPEGSVRDHLDDNPDARASLAAALAPATHSLVFARSAADATIGRGGPTHLSAYLINHASDTFDTYDKSHLVPFGEYIPVPGLFNRLGFSSLTGQFINRVPGQGAQTLAVPNSPSVGVFICYDSIYTGQVIDAANRPEWMATITEDAWYILPGVPFLSKTAGPYQHLAESKLRAVEEGLSVARASNPGISLVVDAFGREWSHRLQLSTSGTIDSTVPKGLKATPYARFGPNVAYISLTFIFALFFVGISFRYRQG